MNLMGNAWMGTIGGGAAQQYDCTATVALLTKHAERADVHDALIFF